MDKKMFDMADYYKEPTEISFIPTKDKISEEETAICDETPTTEFSNEESIKILNKASEEYSDEIVLRKIHKPIYEHKEDE